MKKKVIVQIYEKSVNFFLTLLRPITLTKKNSAREVMYKSYIESTITIIFRPILKTFFRIQWRKTSDFVESKYDKITGSYLYSNYYDGKNKKIFAFVDNKIKKVTIHHLEEKRTNEYYNILKKYSCKKILEVGAGELTKIGPLSKYLGNDIEYYAMDISLNRVFHGRKDFIKRYQHKIEVCKANAIALPYPDNYFDIVFTSHCLEHMPYDYKKAINEMCRVTKKTVVLFEPSYELGGKVQRKRMKAQDYVRGIPKYVHSLKKASLKEYFLLKNGDLLNRTACHIIEVQKQKKEQKTPSTFHYCCPKCNSALKVHKQCFLCQKCDKVYFSFEDIPLLDEKYSFYIGNKYLT